MSYYEVHVTLDQSGDHDGLKALMRPRGWWCSKFDLDGDDEDASGKVFYTNQFDTQERATRAMYYFTGVATGMGYVVLRGRVEHCVIDSKEFDRDCRVGADGVM